MKEIKNPKRPLVYYAVIAMLAVLLFNLLAVPAMANAAVTLLKYLRKGYLFIFGGTIILSGAYTVLVEFLLNLNFHVHDEFIWSFYPFSVSFILGVMLIVIGICRPLRESLHKKFFL